MKIIPFIVASLFHTLFMISIAHAAEQAPLDAPAQINNLNEDDPAVTNRKKENRQQTTQTIQNGEQTEVRVTTEAGTYSMKPNQSMGNSLPGDVQSSSNHPVQWIVKSWGGSKNTEPAETPPELQTNPDNSDPSTNANP